SVDRDHSDARSPSGPDRPGVRGRPDSAKTGPDGPVTRHDRTRAAPRVALPPPSGPREDAMTRPCDAAELLCSVLSLPRYRRRWLRHVRRMAPDASVHHAAVAEVIVRHLVESGELDGN